MIAAMEQEKIIRTRYKAKIPHLLSYSVGAKAISDALVDVPQFDELFLEFQFSNQLARRHGTGTPYSVFEAEYSGPFRHFSKPKQPVGLDTRRWTIIVRAVPRSLRHRIQGKILGEALPAVRSWLVENPHSSEREGHYRIDFSFDELKNELACERHASTAWQTARTDQG